MRRARWAMVAVIGAVALTACGGEEGTPDGAAAPAPTVTVTVTETATPSDADALAETPTAHEEPTDGGAGIGDEDACDADGLEGYAFIFVTSHRVGQVLGDGDTVSGCANTFEASYLYEVLDRDGAVVDEGFGTATCGTGCVGEFSFEVDFSVAEEMIGTLRVYASSAQDGSDTLVNAIPVRLLP